MLKLFRSVKLTLPLLLLLAVLSVGGTISPVEAQRYELFYQSFWFRLLLGLLALNILCCTLYSLPRKWHYHRHLLEGLQGRQAGGIELAGAFDRLPGRLAERGYSVALEADQLVASRGGFGRWGAPLVHLAVLLIMLGGVLGEAGFVGTINTYLQRPNHLYFDWDQQANQELGFSVRVDAFRLRYYPIQLRFELLDTASGVNHGQRFSYDNQNFALPGTTLRAQLRGFDPEQRLLTADIFDRETRLGEYLLGDNFERFEHGPPPFRLLNLEFRDPLLKQTETDVSLLEGEQIVKQGTIRVNEPLTYRGVSIYQTAYGRDQSGNRSVGLQLSKDPGEWLVWVATLLLLAGLAIAFLWPRRAFGIKRVGGQLQLFPLHGWQGEGGQQQLDKLLQHLDG